LIFVEAFEYLSPDKRTFGLNIIPGIFYCALVVLSPWFAIWVGNWRKYLFIASVPALVVLLYPVSICESAHWLMMKNRHERAIKCLKTVAKRNHRHVDDTDFQDFINHYRGKADEEAKLNENRNVETFFHLFRTTRRRIKTIILIIES